MKKNIFPDGYPPLTVYTQIAGNRTYSDMKNFSERFRQSNAVALEYYSNQWVANPLHTWSRIWEYTFVYERLTDIAYRVNSNNLRILDAGSGLTFYPHFVASRHSNMSIDCGDYDPQLQIDAEKLIAPAVQAVSYSFQDIGKLTYPNRIFDAIYCISVLEHCDQYDETVAELARVLKPGGRLILTIDISLDSQSDIPLEKAAHLIEHLAQRFVPDSDYLNMVNSPDESNILTTAYARRVDPSLLPWKGHSWRSSLYSFIRHGRFLKAPFSSLSCFCMSWTSPNIEYGKIASR